jgi:hypothetical protein
MQFLRIICYQRKETSKQNEKENDCEKIAILRHQKDRSPKYPAQND